MVILEYDKIQLKKVCQRSYDMMRLWLLLLLLPINVLAENKPLPAHYQWGQGYHIPAYQLSLGGYMKASYRYLNQTGEHKAALNDFSLFISWRAFTRVQFFSEIEFEDAFNWNKETFQVERLYADLLINDAFKVRFGKILTPFSRWNTLHVAPLVWTVSRPMISEDFVTTQHMTGLNLNYSRRWQQHTLDVQIFGDDSKDLKIHNGPNRFDYATGARVRYQLNRHLNVGSSFIRAKKPQRAWQSVIGFDFLWEYQQFEAQLESYIALNTQLGRPQYGLYLQSVIPLFNHVFTVGRYEYLQHYNTPLNSAIKAIHVGVIGLVWRPVTPLVLKLEYRFGLDNDVYAPNGLLSSIALFF